MIATNLGKLTIFKFSKKKKLIHMYDGHLKEIASIGRNSTTKSEIISASLDGTVKIWCLDVINSLAHSNIEVHYGIPIYDRRETYVL